MTRRSRSLTVQKIYGPIAGVTVTAMRLDDVGGAHVGG